MNAVEINSSFYRLHRTTTYERWAASVPESFRFAVKVPKAITHEHRLKNADDLLDRFLSEVSGLGPKLGPLLVQLPPSLRFEDGVADIFLSELRSRVEGPLVCEPRHTSWSRRTSRACSTSFGLPGWPPIRPRCQALTSQAAGVACRTIACTDLPGSITLPTVRNISRPLPSGSREMPPQGSKLGASSTTRQPLPRRAMRSRREAWC